jgi:hypothetical protein
MKKLMKMALSGAMLATAQGALAESIYLQCDASGSHGYGDVGVIRLTLDGAAITGWHWWDESSRAWRSTLVDCHYAGAVSATAGERVTCRAEPGTYIGDHHAWSRRDSIDHRLIRRIDRHTGEWSATRFEHGEATGTAGGTCRRAENPELTPAREPVL